MIFEPTNERTIVIKKDTYYVGEFYRSARDGRYRFYPDKYANFTTEELTTIVYELRSANAETNG